MPDRIRLVVEIGSLHTRSPASVMRKAEISKQLYNYMVMLGDDGDRWAGDVLGVGIAGTEVCYSRPYVMLSTNIGFTQALVWSSLYDDTFVKEMDRVARLCREDED